MYKQYTTMNKRDYKVTTINRPQWYTICCTCGKPMKAKKYPSCDSCYTYYKNGGLYDSCILCGTKFYRPQVYGSCPTCYRRKEAENNEAA